MTLLTNLIVGNLRQFLVEMGEVVNDAGSRCADGDERASQFPRMLILKMFKAMTLQVTVRLCYLEEAEDDYRTSHCFPMIQHDTVRLCRRCERR